MIKSKQILKKLMQMEKLVQERSVKELCEMYKLTNNREEDIIPTIRGLIMEELELKSTDCFNEWMESDDVYEIDHPSVFFNNK